MTDDPLLTWKGRRVRSAGDGPESSVRKVPGVPIRPGSLFFVPSPLEGWGIDVLLDRLPDGCSVVLYEKDPELRAFCGPRFRSYLGPRAADPRIFWLEADSETEVRRLFSVLPLNKLRRCEFLPLNGGWIAHGPRYREVLGRLENGVKQWWANRLTWIHMGPLWVRNLIGNLTSPGFAASQWPDWGSDPVLVCGAGVSLEPALEWLLPRRSRIRVLAADTALAVLREAGVVPDAVVCLEAQHANLRDFAGWAGADLTLFSDLTSFPPGNRVFRRPPCWFISEFAPLRLWRRWPWEAVPVVPPLGSVGVAAAWTAWNLTRGPVVLAGLDFSYPVGKTHARGAPALGGLLARTHRFLPVEPVGSWARPGTSPGKGNWLTTPALQAYAGVLADAARPQAGRTVVWDDQGLSLGLPVWDRVLGPPLGALVEPGRLHLDPLRWLSAEKELWEKALGLLENQSEAAAESLAELDYLTFSLPDPEYRPDGDWLVRVQGRLNWALSRLHRS